MPGGAAAVRPRDRCRLRHRFPRHMVAARRRRHAGAGGRRPERRRRADRRIAGDVLAATRTVTFAALKPGLLMPPGSALAGEVEVADIGLDTSARPEPTSSKPPTSSDGGRTRDEYAHKWAAGRADHRRQFDGMTGAPRLVAHGGDACRGRDGASVDPGHDADRRAHRDSPAPAARHIVGRRRPWRRSTGSTRSSSGPGSVDPTTPRPGIRKIVVEAPLPMVIDGDGLFALGWSSEGAAALLRRRRVADRPDPARRRVCIAVGQPAREPTEWWLLDAWRPTAGAPCC